MANEAASPRSPPQDAGRAAAERHAAPAVVPHAVAGLRRCRSTTPTWCSKRPTGCWSSTSTPCTSASCSSNSAGGSGTASSKSSGCSSRSRSTCRPSRPPPCWRRRTHLAELGLEVSDFGGNTVLLSSYPTLLGRRPPHDICQAVIDHLVTKDRPPTKEALLDHLLATMACKAAVKAGDRLTPDEIAHLLHLRAAGRRQPPLPARPAHVAAVQPAGARQAIPPIGLILSALVRRLPGGLWTTAFRRAIIKPSLPSLPAWPRHTHGRALARGPGKGRSGRGLEAVASRFGSGVEPQVGRAPLPPRRLRCKSRRTRQGRCGRRSKDARPPLRRRARRRRAAGRCWPRPAGTTRDPVQVRGWWLYAMLEGGHPLREKLTLFWHNHFATSYRQGPATPGSCSSRT